VPTAISAYLGLSDLLSLEAASKDISDNMANPGGKPLAWVTAATQAGLYVVDGNKSSIKAALLAVSTFDRAVDFKGISIEDGKSAKELTKAADQIRKIKIKHLQAGGQFADTFIARFSFSPEDVEMLQGDLRATVRSLPISMVIGNNALVLTLIWSRTATRLLVLAEDEASFKPVSVQLRSISSPLILRMEFCFGKPGGEVEGCGLCDTLQSPQALTKSMRGGILCAGIVADLQYKAGMWKQMNALNLDRPDWKASFSQK